MASEKIVKPITLGRMVKKNVSQRGCDNDVDGLVVTFENAAIGDDPTKIASVQMELFPRTGEVALRYDLANVGDATYTAGLVVNGTNHFVEVGARTSEVVFQRVHPDDWDMDGLPNSIDDTLAKINQLATDLTTLLYIEGYPPDWDDEVFRRVLEQMENYKRHHSTSR